MSKEWATRFLSSKIAAPQGILQCCHINKEAHAPILTPANKL